jgi:DNA replication and repair protein RecF
MVLRTLNLNQFRCFESLRLELGPGITLFHGNNAQGKTSILEAACVLLRLQSPRTSTLSECVRFSEKAFAVGGELEGRDPVSLRVQYRESGRRLIVDGENQRSPGEYLRQSGLVVWMANDDLSLVRGGGEGRRKFLDFMASQIFPGYRSALRAYEKALRTRNYLLKRDASPKWPEIDPYSRLLHDYGQVLTSSRRVLVEQLQPKASEAQVRISDSAERLGLVYECASGEGDDLLAVLREGRDDEMRRRQTLAGPHRDDVRLELNGRPAAKFASEGQQRTIALALKLGQANLFCDTRATPPLMLIDDVFGELDPGRRNALMANWPESSQKLITTTHLDWLDERFSDASRFKVAEATVG